MASGNKVKIIGDVLRASRLPRIPDERKGLPEAKSVSTDRQVDGRGYALDILPVLPSSASENSVLGNGWGDALPGWKYAASRMWDPATGKYVELTPTELAAANNPAKLHERFIGTQNRATAGHRLGEFIRNKWPEDGLTSPWARRLGRVGLGGALGAALAGGLAAGINRVYSGMSGGGSLLPVGMSSLIGGGLGAGIGSLIKLSSSAQGTLQAMVRMDNTLPPAEKRKLTQALSQVDASTANTLLQAVRMAGGAAVGALLMRLLFGGGSLMGGLAGAVIAGQFRSTPMTPTGHTLMRRTDALGNLF